jgi:hypothetical protein
MKKLFTFGGIPFFVAQYFVFPVVTLSGLPTIRSTQEVVFDDLHNIPS